MDPFATSSVLQEWVVLAAIFTFIFWVLFVAATTIRRRQQNAMQRHVLDKFSSAKDFADFVQSPAGQKYVLSFTDAVSSPRNSIINSVKTGIVLLCVGAGILTGGGSLYVFSRMVGNVLILVGLGSLIAALVVYFLAKKIGPEEKV
jgi:ABC-type multidrug transport system fused ATPase/permease subunit